MAHNLDFMGFAPFDQPAPSVYYRLAAGFLLECGMDLYDNSVKENWRRWAWKQLRKRSKTQARLSTTVYLCGPEVHDIKAAERNGFIREKMIAIDSLEANVSAARREGVPSLCEKLEDFWRYCDFEVHGVLGDFCGGLTEQRFDLCTSIMFGTTGGCVFNFQRGRETDDFRSPFISACDAHGFSDKHRGRQFMMLMAMWHAHAIEMDDGKTHLVPNLSDISTDIEYGLSSEKIKKHMSHLEKIMDPAFFSYRANNVVMDSVAISNPWPVTEKGDHHWVELMTAKERLRHKALQAKVRALKAVRTMKLG